MDKTKLDLLVTLWPTFPFFERFAHDRRISGIRLNSAMVNGETLADELGMAKRMGGPVPLYFDVKGRQLRVKEVLPNNENLELILNHPISVQTPTVVLFKAGLEPALLNDVKGGTHLTFEGGPEHMVYAGESLHIKNPSLQVYGNLFTDFELERIDKAVKAGFDRYFLSYVEKQEDVDEFRNYIGDSELILKIENKKGLWYVANSFVKKPNVSLMAARGDLYIELDKPHYIMDALKLIIKKDPEASIGSRLLLTVVENAYPECSDLLEMAWMYDLGYRKMMLCDGLCLKEEPLARAVNVFESFRNAYTKNYAVPSQKIEKEKGIILKFGDKLKGYIS